LHFLGTDIAKRLLVELAGALCRIVGAMVVLFVQAEVRIVVQEVAENCLAINGIFSGVQDVVMPENVHVCPRRNIFVGKHLDQVQKATILRFDSAGLLRRPTFARLFMHQLHFDRIQVQLDYCFAFVIRVHGPLLVLITNSFCIRAVAFDWSESSFPQNGHCEIKTHSLRVG
jgi:hypothetical protein